MQTIQTTARIEPNGKLTLKVSPKIEAGDYQIVLIIGEPVKPLPNKPIVDFPEIHIDRWPENLSLRREDLYDDTAR
jgi:hypothetical protein